MTRKRGSATAACGSVAMAVAWVIAISIMPQSEANSSLQIGIGKSATAAQLYAFLQVPPPEDDDWGPITLESCSMAWVVWPTNDFAEGFCLGRWEGKVDDRCRSTSICGCERYEICQVGRKAIDTCSQGNCTLRVYQKNVSESQRPAEKANCRQQALSRVQGDAEGGPYHMWWSVASNANFNFVCNTKYMAAAKNMARGPQCDCERANLCSCGTLDIVSGLKLTKAAGRAALEGQIADPQDSLGVVACETRQDELAWPAAERYSQLVMGRNSESNLESRVAFESTMRLMHELDMVRPAAEEFMQSDLAVPACGVEGWLTAQPVCTSQVPAIPLSVSNNCARLLSSHVVSGTITEDVFRVCTDALRDISLHPYDNSQADCAGEVREDLAQLATDLLEKANS